MAVSLGYVGRKDLQLGFKREVLFGCGPSDVEDVVHSCGRAKGVLASGQQLFAEFPNGGMESLQNLKNPNKIKDSYGQKEKGSCPQPQVGAHF